MYKVKNRSEMTIISIYYIIKLATISYALEDPSSNFINQTVSGMFAIMFLVIESL